MADGTPSDEELEIIGGELTDEEWNVMENEQKEHNLDQNGSENMNVVDGGEEHKNVDEPEAAGDQGNASASSSVQKSETTTLDLKIKADLECRSVIEGVVDTEKKQSSVEFLLFLVKVENVLAKERQQCKARTKAKKSKANMTNGNDAVDDIIDDNNAFDIFNERHFLILLTVLMLV